MRFGNRSASWWKGTLRALCNSEMTSCTPTTVDESSKDMSGDAPGCYRIAASSGRGRQDST